MWMDGRRDCLSRQSSLDAALLTDGSVESGLARAAGVGVGGGGGGVSGWQSRVLQSAEQFGLVPRPRDARPHIGEEDVEGPKASRRPGTCAGLCSFSSD